MNYITCLKLCSTIISVCCLTIKRISYVHSSGQFVNMDSWNGIQTNQMYAYMFVCSSY